MPKVGMSQHLEPSPGGETRSHRLGGPQQEASDASRTRLSRPRLLPGLPCSDRNLFHTRFTPLLGAWGAVREVTPGSHALCPASLLGRGRGGHPTLQPPMTVSPQMQTTPADGFRWAGFFKFAFKNKKQKHFFLD